jgi:hypothetical protein
MSEEKLGTLNDKMEAILVLSKAPSQKIAFFHLLGTGKTAKLLEKGLIQRAPFRARSYSCDSKEILLGMLVTVQKLKERLDKRGL